MASAINALGASTGSSSTSGSSVKAAATSAAQSQNMFLQLLVSQIQNQDPLNPTDSTQFVSQLAQFSELEQVIAIRGDIESQTSTQTATSTTAANATLPVTGGTSSSNKNS
jgi:flagellar basal-body rod modification protein FlgD